MPSRPISPDLEDLLRRGQDKLRTVLPGGDAEMGEALKLSRNTIRNHVFSLYRKIGVNRRGAAIIWARERGITGKDAIKPRKPRAATK